MSHRLFVVLGNQLFPPALLQPYSDCRFFLAEDVGLCTYVRHHKQKIVLFLAAMRSYADALRAVDFKVDYHALRPDDGDYEARLLACCQRHDISELVHFEVEDHFMAQRLANFAAANDLAATVLDSPMFLTTRSQFETYLDSHKRVFMADFYREQRQRLDIMVDADGKPEGGQWSFDADNRKKLPKGMVPPELPTVAPAAHVGDVSRMVKDQFPDHPGSTEGFWLPTTREQALAWLETFLDQRLAEFGPYEDALSTRSGTLFHSALSPLMNVGLLTPEEIVARTLAVAGTRNIPLNSLEGFIRQVIGWREFIRGVYHRYDQEQRERNFFDARRELGEAWWTGETGIPPLDDAIRQALATGWNHHIQRLMVAGNLMTLCGIRPGAAHDWFMSMYVDSSDWVMGPNVYGMALFSDGGIFATKPYVCGSNYLLKMSDYKKGDWCDVVDGLYWGFIDKHREYFGGNPRLAVMTRSLDKMAGDRRERIFGAAGDFLDRHTE